MGVTLNFFLELGGAMVHPCVVLNVPQSHMLEGFDSTQIATM